MPLYEYQCPHCQATFEKLRTFSQADSPARCPECSGEDSRRLISRCASVSRGEDGSTHAVAGGGGCAGCAGGAACAHCGH
ncbi:MAG: FmdB family zinc ribbon protein [Anaerolineae bacterium]|jgi:putative FmdB family regulatory protein|nr:zinc ribbon domain-containing protein [Chloroflexota bacterium]